MAICEKCGSQVQDSVKFCLFCGAAMQASGQQQAAAQPQEYQPQQFQQPQEYQPQQFQQPQFQQPPQPYQQPQPQYQQTYQQQQYAPPPAKKKKKWLKILLIIIGVVVLLGAGGIIYLISSLSVSADADFIKVGSDEVPTVAYILGDKRDVVGTSRSSSGGVSETVIEYKVDSNQGSEMLKYANALIKDYGYEAVTEYNFTESTGKDFQYVIESKQNGYLVVVHIDYNTRGYTLTIVRGKGTLTHG
jgi:hypothetical protein